MGKIFYLMGKSSTGKDTIFNMLKESYPEMRSIILYTTRPIREGEDEGREYFFVGEERLAELEAKNRVIELRAYHTMHGTWKYFTVDDGQVDLDKFSYLVIGTLESYAGMCQYYGADKLLPIYIEVEDGVRLRRALEREKRQVRPKYSEMCRRFLADTTDFSDENLEQCGIVRRFQNHEMDACFQEINLYIKENL